MTKLGKGRVGLVVLSGLAMMVAGVLTAQTRIKINESNVLLPAADEVGALFVSFDPPSGLGAIKGTVNTKNGKIRISIKGEAINLSGKAARFPNNPQSQAVAASLLPGVQIQRSKYSISKPKKATVIGKARGNVSGQFAL